MKKGLKLTVLICAMAMIMCGLSACSFFDGGGVKVTQIQLENTEVYLGESGEASSMQLKPNVLPANAPDKSVSYRIMDSTDKEYLLLSVDGKLDALKAKPEGVVTVRIVSNQNPSVYVDVRVHIVSQEVGVKKIEFNPQEIHLTLNSEPYKAEPIFTPYYAVQGRNVEWRSLNEDFATVDSNGYIRPVAPGVTYIVASTPVITDDEAAVEGQLKVTVTYADLSYRINMENDGPAVMRQIVGRAEEIRLNLLQMDELCDPAPLIRWYINNDRVTESEGKREFRYTPSTLPYGEYTIRAEISNNLQSQRLEYPVKLRMYEPLIGFDLNVLNESESLRAGDVLMLQAGLPERTYVPESFQWYVRAQGETGRGRFIQSTEGPELNYKLTREGIYEFTAVAVIKGVVSDVENTTDPVVVNIGEVGSNISDIYADAYLEGETLVPAIKWRYPGYAAYYTVELTKEDGSVQIFTSERVESGVAPMILLPEVTVNESFSVRVRTDRFGWSAPYDYAAGTIAEADAQYMRRLEEQGGGYALGINGYIVNMKEMGDLLNYISLFRPEALRKTDAEKPYTYVVHYKTAFRYDDLDAQKYPYTSDATTDNPELKDIYRIIYAAFNAYAETGAFSADYAIENDGVRLTMSFEDAPYTELKKTGQTGITEGKTKAHYSAQGSESLPIESETVADMTVSTSNQLMYALTHGLYPVRAPGSAAERVWNKAKAVSLRIIDAGMTDAEKIHAIYDYLTLEVIYDYDLLTLANTQRKVSDYAGFYLEGVFDDGIAVCDGISKAFMLLARMQGIASEKVAGRAGDIGSEVGHAWNLVMIDGKWYVCDATWGNRRMPQSMETQSHDFLLTSDAFIADDHIGFGEYPPADEAMDIYFGVDRGGYDAILDSVEELQKGAAAILLAAIAQGETEYYWEVTLSNEMREFLAAQDTGGILNALDFVWHSYANKNGCDAKTYAIGEKYYLWVTRKEN